MYYRHHVQFVSCRLANSSGRYTAKSLLVRSFRGRELQKLAASTATTTYNLLPPQEPCHYDWEEQVQRWQEHLKRVDRNLNQALGLLPKGNHRRNTQKINAEAFGSPKLAAEVQSVVQTYRRLVSQLARVHYQQQQQKGTDGSQPQCIMGHLLAQRPFGSTVLSRLDETQRLLLESSCVRFDALHKVQARSSRSSNNNNKGFDDLAFVTLKDQQRQWTKDQLKNTRYGRSTKS